MKRFAFILGLLLCLVLLFTACQGEETTVPMSSSSAEMTAAAPEVAYSANVFAAVKLSDEKAEVKSGVLHSYLDFNVFISHYRHYFLYGDITRYDEAFFERYFLIALPVKTTATSDRPYVSSLIQSKELVLSVGIHTTENRDDTAWEWLVLVEVSCDDVVKSRRRVEVVYLPQETISDDLYRTKYSESLERKDLSALYRSFKIGSKIDVMPFLAPRLITTYDAFLAHKQELIDYLVFDLSADLPFARYDEAYFEEHNLIVYLFDLPIQDEYYLKRVIRAGDTVTVFIDSYTESEVEIPAAHMCYAIIEIETDGKDFNKATVRYW